MNCQYLDSTQAAESSPQDQTRPTFELNALNAPLQQRFQAQEMPSINPNDSLETDLIQSAGPTTGMC